MTGRLRGNPLRLPCLILSKVRMGTRLAPRPLEDSGNALRALCDVSVTTNLLELVQLGFRCWHHATEGLEQQHELVGVHVACS